MPSTRRHRKQTKPRRLLVEPPVPEPQLQPVPEQRAAVPGLRHFPDEGHLTEDYSDLVGANEIPPSLPKWLYEDMELQLPPALLGAPPGEKLSFMQRILAGHVPSPKELAPKETWYADQQKDGTISGSVQELTAQLGEETPELGKYTSKVGTRIQYMYEDTLMLAAAAASLDPESHYSVGFDKEPYYRNKLLDVIARMADTPESGIKATEELGFYSANKGNFGGVMARIGARTVSPATWWSTYGGDVPTLQKYAMHIVSHCVSSSSCEPYWSRFELIHTKVRNMLVYIKPRKLVYVHHDLKLKLQQNETCQEEKEVNDPCAEANSIMDGLNNSWSESEPVLDKGGRPSPVIGDALKEEGGQVS